MQETLQSVYLPTPRAVDAADALSYASVVAMEKSARKAMAGTVAKINGQISKDMGMALRDEFISDPYFLSLLVAQEFEEMYPNLEIKSAVSRSDLHNKFEVVLSAKRKGADNKATTFSWMVDISDNKATLAAIRNIPEDIRLKLAIIA